MSWSRSISRWLVCTSVVLLSTTGVVTAQNATLYEVTETMKLRGRGPEDRTRQATAALAGWIQAGTTLCPAELAAALGIGKCGVVALAWDNLSLKSGTGPVSGGFAVVIQGDNPVDGYEFVIARGSIHGRIDLSAALLGGMPMGALQAAWSADGVRGGPLDGLKVKGQVSGVFRLPFVYGLPDGCLDAGNPAHCAYVSQPSYLFGDSPDAYWPQAVQSHELSLGTPTVRLDLNFVTTDEGWGNKRQSRRDRNRD
jgi:hypothetical protein